MTEKHTAVEGSPERFRIADTAKGSSDFRRTIWTGEHSQVVLMTVPAGGEIGDEVHESTDQILTFVSGSGEADIDGQTHPVEAGDLYAVPAGTRHNFRNTGEEPLVLYTVYAPPEHATDARYATKEEADAAEASGEDSPPEG